MLASTGQPFQSVRQRRSRNIIFSFSQNASTPPVFSGTSPNSFTNSLIIFNKNKSTAHYRNAKLLWEKLTNDPIVLDIVKGYKTALYVSDKLASPKSYHLSNKEIELVHQEFQEKLRKEGICGHEAHCGNF